MKGYLSQALTNDLADTGAMLITQKRRNMKAQTSLSGIR
ncbi:hypothetical protein [Xenorhabdus hominickii]